MKQTTRTLLTLVIFAAVGGALALYARYGVYEADEREAKQKAHDERLFAPEKVDEKNADGGVIDATFTKLTVTNQGETTVVERDAQGRWRITRPVQANADRLTVDALTSALQSTKVKAKVDEKPDSAALAKYGLDAPQFVVIAESEVGASKEKRTVTLKGGIENTYDGSIFLQRNDDPTVWSVEGGARWTLAKGTFDLREKEIAPLDEKDLVAVSVTAGDKSYLLERGGDKRWVLVKPTPNDADQDAVKGMLGAMKGDRATAFPDDSPEARRALGLDRPYLVATLTTQGNEKTTLTFSRQPTDGGATRCHVLREDSSGTLLAEVGVEAPGRLDKSLGELKDKSLLRFERTDVAKVVVHTPGSPEIVLAKAQPDGGSGESWVAQAPQTGAVKAFKVASMLWTLGAMKATAFREEHPKDWAKYGLDASARFVSLQNAQGQELSRLTIGKELPGTQGTRYFRGFRDQVLEADGARLTEIPSSLAELLDLPADAGSPDSGH